RMRCSHWSLAIRFTLSVPLPTGSSFGPKESPDRRAPIDQGRSLASAGFFLKAAPAYSRERSAKCHYPYEDNNMNRFLILSALALSTTLIVPIAARAEGRNHHEKRYYD